jgi:hypothetical protein
VRGLLVNCGAAFTSQDKRDLRVAEGSPQSERRPYSCSNDVAATFVLEELYSSVWAGGRRAFTCLLTQTCSLNNDSHKW